MNLRSGKLAAIRYRAIVALAVIFCLQSAIASAATITWSSEPYLHTGSKKEFMGTGQFDRSGTLIYAENCGGVATNFDGIDFSADSGLFTNTAHNWNASGFHNSAAINPISDTALAYWGGGLGSEEILLGTGGVGYLAVGRKYRIQLFVMDGRGFVRSNEVDSVDQGSYANGDGGTTTWGEGLLVAGTFTADDTNQSFTVESFQGGSTVGAQLNAFLLSQIPIVDEHLYELGEPGTVGSRPLDSIASADFDGGANGVVSSLTPSPVSTNYMSFDGSSAFYWMNGGYASAFPTDDFAVECWARASNTTQEAVIFITGNSDGRLKLILTGGKWRANYHNVGWIDDDSATAEADEWTHLAVIRTNGNSRFYVDGRVRGGPSTATPLHNGRLHLACESGGSGRFKGDIDNVRLYSFDSDLTAPAASLTLNEDYIHFSSATNFGTERAPIVFTDPELTTPVTRGASTFASPVYIPVNGIEADGSYWNAVIQVDGLLGDGAGTPGRGGAGIRMTGRGFLMRGDGSSADVLDQLTFSLHSSTELTSTGQVLGLQKLTGVVTANFRVSTQAFNDGAGNNHAGAGGGSQHELHFDLSVDSKQIIGTGSGTFRLHAAKFQFGAAPPASIFTIW